MADYRDVQQKFFCDGMWLSLPVDACKFEQYPFLNNVRSYTEGVIESRAGLTEVSGTVSAQTPWHSARRIENENNNSDVLFGGQGSIISANHTGSFSAVDTGYSGNPLSMFPFRPNKSPHPWLYIGDINKFRKYHYDGSSMQTHQIGLPPPTEPPTVNLSTSERKIIELMDSATGWSVSSGSTASIGVTDRLVATMTYDPIYDDGSAPSWASVVPNSTSGAMAEGMLAGVGTTLGSPTEYAVIQEIHREGTTSAIDTVVYENAPTNTGICSVTLTTKIKDVAPRQMVTIGANQYQILSVDYGPEENLSFKINVPGGGAGVLPSASVIILPTIRMYLTGTYTAAATTYVTAKGLYFTGQLADHNEGIDYAQKSNTIDLSTFTGGEAVSDDDNIHMGFWASKPSSIVEMRIMFELESMSTNSFESNYFYKTITPDDIEAALDNEVSSVQAERERTRKRVIFDDPIYNKYIPELNDNDPVPYRWSHGDPGVAPEAVGDRRRPAGRGGDTTYSKLFLGHEQYSDLIFKVGSLTRVGTNSELGLKHVKGIRIEVICTEDISWQASSLFVVGGYNPDTGRDLLPYFYRYRGRSSLTGVVSNYSPPTKTEMIPYRQEITLSLPFHTSSEVDKLDVERWGGTITGWRYVGSISNPGSGSASYTDNLGDLEANNNAFFSAGNTNFQPFPIIDSPQSGNLTTSAGIYILDSANSFNILWAPGTQMKLAGKLHTIHRVISTSVIELVESADSGSGIEWEIEEPVLLGQNLRAVFDGPNGVMFGVGDDKNAGTLYRTYAHNPDATNERLKLEVTPPSEPLMNGMNYNGRGYLWSTERMFQILPSSSPFGFDVVEVPSGRGLVHRWSLCKGPSMWWLSDDGIYESTGGAAKNITEARLGLLFMPEGKTATTINNVPIVDIDNGSIHRLAYSSDGFLYFDYESNGSYRTLIYETGEGRWWMDSFNGMGATFHYAEEGSHRVLVGGNDGSLYERGGASDPGGGINLQFLTGAFDMGDARTNKLLMDAALDYESNGLNVNYVIRSHTTGTTVTSGTIATSAGSRQQDIIDINNGKGTLTRTVMLDCSMTNTTAHVPVAFYQWQFSLFEYPEDSLLRGTDFYDQEFMGRKYVRGVILESDTSNIARTVRIIKDGGAVADTITVQSNGRTQKEFGLEPFDTYLLQILPDDAESWRYFKHGFIYDKYPGISTTPTPWDSLGTDKAKFMQGFYLRADTGGQDAAFTVQSDGGVDQETFTVNATELEVTEFSFDQPFITHLVRIKPVNDIGIHKVEWIWEPEPPAADHWETQQTDLGMSGFKTLRAMYMPIFPKTAGGTHTLTIRADGESTSINIPDPGAVRREVYVALPCLKAKTYEFYFSSTVEVRVYQRDMEIFAKQWGSNGPFVPTKPFGDDHRSHGGGRI